MGDALPPSALSLPNADAAQWNRDRMLQFQTVLERNPEADLMSMFSDSYTSSVIHLGISQKSTYCLQNLRFYHMPGRISLKVQGPKFRTRLDLARTATVVFPLSKKVAALLAQYLGGSSNHEPMHKKH